MGLSFIKNQFKYILLGKIIEKVGKLQMSRPLKSHTLK